MWFAELKVSCCFFYSFLHSSWQLTWTGHSASSKKQHTRTTNIEQCILQQFWVVKPNISSIARAIPFQTMPLKKAACEQIKAILLFCSPLGLTYKPSEAFNDLQCSEDGWCAILRPGNSTPLKPQGLWSILISPLPTAKKLVLQALLCQHRTRFPTASDTTRPCQTLV